MANLNIFYERFGESVFSLGTLYFIDSVTNKKVNVAELGGFHRYNESYAHNVEHNGWVIKKIIIKNIIFRSSIFKELDGLELRYETLVNKDYRVTREICVMAKKFNLLKKDSNVMDIEIPLYDEYGEAIESFRIREKLRG